MPSAPKDSPAAGAVLPTAAWLDSGAETPQAAAEGARAESPQTGPAPPQAAANVEAALPQGADPPRSDVSNGDDVGSGSFYSDDSQAAPPRPGWWSEPPRVQPFQASQPSAAAPKAPQLPQAVLPPQAALPGAALGVAPQAAHLCTQMSRAG